MPAEPAIAAPPSVSLFDAAERHLPGAAAGAYALADDIRLIFSHAQGARILDVDGREFIDHVGGAGALIAGHAHPAVVDAAQKQIARGAHIFGALSDVAIALAERLVAAIPCAEKIVYATTGSEATAYAMRLARAFTGRDKILKFEGAYHGNHDHALVSAFPHAPPAYPSGAPDSSGQSAAAAHAMLIAPFNDIDETRRIVAEHARDIAAIIVEPVQRIIPAQKEFLAALRALCDAHDIVLIFDEVVTGFRLAKGGAQEWFGVLPDLATYGKVIGAGGPLSCIAGRAEMIDLAAPQRANDFRARRGKYAYFNGTLHGNPVAAAATLALLDELSREGVYAKLNQTAAELCRECQSVLDKHQIPALALHTGSLWQILFVKKPPRNHRDVMQGDAAAMRRLDSLFIKQGHYVLPGVRRFVSTAHGAPEIEASVRGLDAACRAFA